MATADDVLAQLDVAFSAVDANHGRIDASTKGLGDTASHLDQVRSTAEELAEQSQQMGFEDKVAIIQVAIDKSNEAQSQFNAARQALQSLKNILNGAVATLREARAHIQALEGSLRGAPRAAQVSRSAKRSVRPWTAVPADYPRGRVLPLEKHVLRHVCDGEPRRVDRRKKRGGHLFGTGRPNKTEFPPEWDRDRIAEVLMAVANDPDNVRPEQRRGNWVVLKRIEGVDVVVIVTPGGDIRAGWPLKGPRVWRNPSRRRMKKERGVR